MVADSIFSLHMLWALMQTDTGRVELNNAGCRLGF